MAESYAPAVLPVLRRPHAPLPEARRAAFELHLRAVVAGTVPLSAASTFDDAPATHRALGAACALCPRDAHPWKNWQTWKVCMPSATRTQRKLVAVVGVTTRNHGPLMEPHPVGVGDLGAAIPPVAGQNQRQRFLANWPMPGRK